METLRRALSSRKDPVQRLLASSRRATSAESSGTQTRWMVDVATSRKPTGSGSAKMERVSKERADPPPEWTVTLREESPARAASQNGSDAQMNLRRSNHSLGPATLIASTPRSHRRRKSDPLLAQIWRADSMAQIRSESEMLAKTPSDERSHLRCRASLLRLPGK